MSELNGEHFDAFFNELHGFDPFPWQSRLARRVVAARGSESAWPEALALPTAAGKTACIDIAVFALACQSGWEPGERTAPRRIFFVVDRRVIVDATYERAKRIEERLQWAEGGIVGEVAGRLLSLARGNGDHGVIDDDAIPLDVFRMRGGAYRDDRWVRSPFQPAVIVSTVDQFGSRLLFRGYGLSRGMRPIHAGLAGNDSLVVLDEAHCANPFRQTMSHVGRYRSWAGGCGVLPSLPHRAVLLSATPPEGVAETFTADEADRDHRKLGPRIGCAKPARLVLVRTPASVDGRTGWARRLAEEAVAVAKDQRRNIGVMVNRVATAKSVCQALTGMGHDALLLTGRMRSIDQDRVVRRLDGLRTGEEREGNGLRFVVATQTLEVGADLDFDGLVTECASLDALRQRFGRLNRGGRPIEALGVIMAQSAQLSRRGRVDPVYGETLADTWEWLMGQAADGTIDLGHEALERLLPEDPDHRRELLSRLSAPAPDAPVLLPAHIDAWVQTWPEPTPDPDVSVFLHGPDQRVPDVQVCWRSDLSGDLSRYVDLDRAVQTLSLCPPVSAECIAVPIPNLRRWLGGDDAGHHLSDLGAAVDDYFDGRAAGLAPARAAIRWRGPDDWSALTDGTALRPGDTVVIPAELGGWDVFGHIPEPDGGGEPVIDVGDEAHLWSRGTPLLRIHERTLDAWPDCPARDDLLALARRRQILDDDDLAVEKLREIAADEGAPEWLKKAATGWCKDRQRKTLEHPDGGVVLKGIRRVADGSGELGTPTDEDDTYSATVEVPLEDHLDGVAQWAVRFGRGAGLSHDLQRDLVLAARFHDVGKADHRMQAMFHGGSFWAAAASENFLAKSAQLPSGLAEFIRARQACGYPVGFRHELVSARLMESGPGLLDTAADRDLALHLVTSHHGRGRPFAPVVEDPNPISVELDIFGYAMSAGSRTGLERLDSGVPERFWRLVRRYGWWGLAWLEALVRMADQRRSEAELRGATEVSVPHEEAAG